MNQGLVAGGYNSVSEPANADLYDPQTGIWSSAGGGVGFGAGGTMTLLGDGNVLVTGDGGADVYDPQSGTWTTTGAMQVESVDASAALLGDGDVLVAGGYSNSSNSTVASAELYDPATNTWSTARPMSQTRYDAALQTLPDGDVLVAGGYTDTGPGVNLSSAELYDPAANSWSPTGTMNVAHSFAASALLGDGDVLVVGGVDSANDLTVTAELYDPSTGSWSLTGSMAQARAGAASTLLSDGDLLVVGNDTNATAENTDTAEVYQAPQPPTPTLAEPSSVTDTTATLAGIVDPQGSATRYEFELSSSPQFSSAIDLPAGGADAGAGDGAVPVSQPVSGLVPGSIYYMRLVATNPFGTASAPAQQFTTPTTPPPVTTITTTTPATTITTPATTTTTTSPATTTTEPLPPSPLRLSAVSATDSTTIHCHGQLCRYAITLRFKLNHATAVRTQIRAEDNNRWRQVASTVIPAHTGTNHPQLAGHLPTDLHDTKSLQVLVQFDQAGRWSTQKTLRVAARHT